MVNRKGAGATDCPDSTDTKFTERSHFGNPRPKAERPMRVGNASHLDIYHDLTKRSQSRLRMHQNAEVKEDYRLRSFLPNEPIMETARRGKDQQAGQDDPKITKRTQCPGREAKGRRGAGEKGGRRPDATGDFTKRTHEHMDRRFKISDLKWGM